VTKDVDRWPAPADTAATPPAGFTVLVSAAGKPIVAVREESTPQVWVNADLDAWSRDPAFVVFFSNAFTWLGAGGASEFVAHPVGQLGDDWSRVDDSPAPAGVEPGLWPGLYRRRDGAMRAINAPDVQWQPPAVTDWRRQLDRQAVQTGGTFPLRSWPCLAAIACAALAAVVWPSSRSKNRAFLGQAQDRQPQRV
jgi:hypothetical protein